MRNSRAGSRNWSARLKAPDRASLSCCLRGLEAADVPRQAFVEEIDHGPDARGVANALVGEQPQYAAMAIARRDAADEVRVGIPDDAGQDCNPETRSDRSQQARGAGVVHRDPVLQVHAVQPFLIVAPELLAAAADD